VIQKKLDDSLAKIQEERKNRTSSGKISPSQMGYCFRRQHWHRKGEPVTNPPDARLLRVFKCGNLFEDFVSVYLSKDIERQVLVETEDIKGYADFVLPDEAIDIKSQNSKAFWWAKRDGYDITVEKRPNILQVMTYAYLLDKSKGKLVFISKDDLCIEEYGFHIDKWKPEIEKELKTLRKYWIEDTLPPAQPRCFFNKKLNKFKECDYCPFKTRCEEKESK